MSTARYLLHLVDAQIDGGWHAKHTIMFFIEFITDIMRFFFYFVFFSIVFLYYGIPIYFMRDLWVSYTNIRKRIQTYVHCCHGDIWLIVKAFGEEVHGTHPPSFHYFYWRWWWWFNYLDVACVFFEPDWVVALLPLMPLRISRYIRYRKLTSNMDEKFPNATEEVRFKFKFKLWDWAVANFFMTDIVITLSRS